MSRLAAIDAIVNSASYAPRWGFHDDHRHNDRTAAYLPAIQQVRSEFLQLLDVLERHGALQGRCLQLGLGECGASHELWCALFAQSAATLDRHSCLFGRSEDIAPGCNTHHGITFSIARRYAPYSFLFIDAGHKIEDVRADHTDYERLVSPGGIIAFHDALKRPGYEDEVDVWRYMEELEQRMQVNLIGTEVGVAWIVKQ